MTEFCNKLGYIRTAPSARNRSTESQYWRIINCIRIPSLDVSYDPTISPCSLLSSTNVQRALDELCGLIDTFEVRTAFPITGTGQLTDPISLDGIMTDGVTIVGDGVNTPIEIGAINTDGTLIGDGSNSSPLSVVQPTLVNAGAGSTLVNDGIGPTLATKSLTAGTNVTFIETATDIVMNVVGGGGGGGGAPANAEYVVLTNDATLTDERALVAGLGIALVDGGANSAVTLNVGGQNVGTTTGATATALVFDTVSADDLDFRTLTSFGLATSTIGATASPSSVLRDTDLGNNVVRFRNLNSVASGNLSAKPILVGTSSDSTTILFRQIVGGPGINTTIDPDGNVETSLSPGRSIPLNYRFNDPSGNPTSVTSTSYTSLGSILFRGTMHEEPIKQVFGILEVTGGNAVGQAIIYDLTNSLIIASTSYFANTGGSGPDAKDIIEFNGLGQNISAFSTKNPGLSPTLTLIYASNNNVGNVLDSSGTAPFTITVLKQGGTLYGEFTTIDTFAATSGSVDGTWFVLYFGVAANDYIFFWYDTDDSGTPQPVDPIGGGGSPFEINTVVTGDTNTTIAIKTSDAINTAATIGPKIINLPVNEAIMEFQLRRVNSGGGGNSEVHTLQVYG